MIHSFYIAKKAALYLCIATVPTAAVVTRDPGPKTSRVIARAKHSVNRVTHRKVFKEPKVEATATAIATATAYCPPVYEGLAGGEGGLSGYGLGSGGGSGIDYGFSTPSIPVVGNPSSPPIVPISPTIPTSSVPEPATWVTMVMGLGIVGGAMRQKRSKTTSV